MALMQPLLLREPLHFQSIYTSRTLEAIGLLEQSAEAGFISFYKDRGLSPWPTTLAHYFLSRGRKTESPRCRARSRSYKGFISFYLKGSSVTQLPPGTVHSHQHTTQEPLNEDWEGPRDDDKTTRALGADRQVAPSGSSSGLQALAFLSPQAKYILALLKPLLFSCTSSLPETRNR